MTGFSLILLLFGLTLFAYSYQAHLMSKNPDKPETFSEWTSLILYHLGDLVSRTPGLLSTTLGYKAYQKFMGWSADLDKRDKIWKTPTKPAMPTQRPSVIIFWSEEDQCFLAKIPECPGVLADGRTRLEALQNAEGMEKDWAETAQALGRRL